ncbi:MAG: hypothetical protein ABIJ74_00720 [archaeon]
MGFFDRIFGKKQVKEEVQPKDKIFLGLSEAKDFAEKTYSDSFFLIQKEVFSRFSEIKHLVKELELVLKELEETKVEENTGNPRLRKIVFTSKKTLTDKMSSLASKLSPPSSNDFIELNSFTANSIAVLESEINSFGKNIAYTGIVLKEPVKKLGERIKELNFVFLETKNLFDSKKMLLLLPEIKGLLSELKEKIELHSDSVSAEEQVSEKISLAEKELVSVKEKLVSLENSAEALQFRKLLEEKSILAERKQEMKSKLIQLFYPVDKQLIQFNKLAESKRFILSEEEKSILGSYLSNPFFALKKDNKAVVLKKIFVYVKDLVEKGKISLKEKEKAKKLSALDELIEFDFFSEVFWKFNELEKKIIEADYSISHLDVSGRISGLKESIASLENSCRNFSAELEKQRKNSLRIYSDVLQLKSVLEEKLGVFSGKQAELKLKQ